MLLFVYWGAQPVFRLISGQLAHRDRPRYSNFSLAGSARGQSRDWQAGKDRYAIGPARFVIAVQISVYRSASIVNVGAIIDRPAHKYRVFALDLGEYETFCCAGAQCAPLHSPRHTQRQTPICLSVSVVVRG